MFAKIITDFNPPPVPFRDSDWRAWRAGGDADAPEGRGGSPQEAIQDLLDAEEESLAADDEMAAADCAYADEEDGE